MLKSRPSPGQISPQVGPSHHVHTPNLRSRLASGFLAVLTTCLPATAPGNDVAPAGVDLFEAAPPSPRPRTAAPAEDRAVRNRRRVRVRRDLLQAPPAVTPSLRFNLFPGAAFTGVPDRDERTADGDRVIAGTLAGVPGSSFLLVTHGEEVVVDVFVTPLERYQLRREPGEDGAPEVRRLDPLGLPSCGGSLTGPRQRSPGPLPRASAVHPVPGAPRPRAEEAPGEADDPGTFDVLIAYTPAARVAAGGLAVIESQARFAVEGANQRYANSGVATRARLVQTLEVPYTESVDGVFDDLTHLITDATGPLAEVRARRDAASADVACLFVAAPRVVPRDGLFVGAGAFAVDLGADGQPFGVPELGFSVVMPAYDVATTFAHELGHNFGCQHDIENVTFQGVNYGPGIFPYSYGYRFFAPNGSQYRDVMAYEPGFVIPYFSNPRVSYSDAPTGSAEADNAQTINRTAPLIANLRRPVKVSVLATDAHAVEKPPEEGRFTIRRTGPTDMPLTVGLNIPQGLISEGLIGVLGISLLAAVPGVDYAPLPDQVVIPAGQQSVDLRVVPVEDGRPDGPDQVFLELRPGNGYILDTRGRNFQKAGVIIHDTATTVSIAPTVPVAVREPLTAGQFTLTRTGPLDQPLTVLGSVYPYPSRFVGSPPDYTLIPSSTDVVNTRWVIPAGAASLDIQVLPTIPAPSLPLPFPNSSAYRGVLVELSESSDYEALVPAAQVSILERPADTFPLPVLVLTAPKPTASFLDGATGELVVTRTGPTDASLSLALTTRGSALAEVDYRLRVDPPASDLSGGYQPFGKNLQVYMAPGVSTMRLVLTPAVTGDLVTRSATVTLRPDRNGFFTVDPAHSTVTVTLLGTAVVTATVTGPEARATSDLGPVNGEFTLRREGDLSQPLTVRYQAGGTAVAGNRCKALPGVATFPAGQDFVRVKVKPKGNAGGPGARTNVKLTLQPGDGYLVGTEARAKVKVFGGGGG